MKPMKVEVTVDHIGRGSVSIDGRDISKNLHSLRIEAGVDELTVVHLALIAVDVTVASEALVAGEVFVHKAREAERKQRRDDLMRAAREGLAAQMVLK